MASYPNFNGFKVLSGHGLAAPFLRALGGLLACLACVPALATPTGEGLATQVVSGLRWLDPWIPLLWLLFTVLGGARLMHLLAMYRQQSQHRRALNLRVSMPGDGQAGGAVRRLWLGAGLAVALVAWVAVAVSGGVGHGLWQRWDGMAQQWAQSLVPVHQLPLWQTLTDAGDVTAVALLIAVGAVVLARQRRWLDLQVWVFFGVFNGLLIRLLKMTFDRMRPENVHDLLVSGASFPSGHSAGSAFVYLLGAVLFTVRCRDGVRWAVLVCAALWAGGIALSRVVLSVHWLSDVVAGLALGAFSVLGACAVLRQLRQAQAD